MLLSSDIHPDWREEDIALFVALVSAFQTTAAQTVAFHRRKSCDVRDLIGFALRTAHKGHYISHGIVSGDLAEAFSACEDGMRADLDGFQAFKRSFAASLLPIQGRA